MSKNESKLLSIQGIAKASAFCLLLSAFSVNAAMAAPASAGTVDEVMVVQQGKKVTGVVVDGAGEPVISANVVVKGTTNGTITDFDGNYTEKIEGKVRSAYFVYDMAGIFIQAVRDLAAYSWLILSLMQGMSIAQFVFLLGVISGFSTWFSTISEMISLLSNDLMRIGYYRDYTESEVAIIRKTANILRRESK